MEIRLIVVVILIAVLFLFYKTDQSTLNTPEEIADKKGRQGEEEVKRILAGLPRTEYVVLNDVLLPAGNGTTQVDHIVVSLYGIFVIEAKNYAGKIYGTRNSEKWSQYLNGEQYNFRNPIKQNLGHVIAIEKATMVSNRNIIPLVVFTGNATLKVQGCDEVIYDGMLLETICRYKEKVFTAELMEVYARIIDDIIEENQETKSAHVNQVREKIVRRDQEVKTGQCPRCNGRLVLRKGKYGDFYGCSNYPRCTYTLSIADKEKN